MSFSWRVFVLPAVLAVLVMDASDAEATCGTYQRYYHQYTTASAFLTYNLNAYCSNQGWCGTDAPAGGVACTPTTPACYAVVDIQSKSYSCATDALQGTANVYSWVCPCGSLAGAEAPLYGGPATLASHPNDAIRPPSPGQSVGIYYSCTEECAASGPEPEVCNGTEAPDTTSAFIDEGCGDDEFQCSAGPNDRDGAPVRFSSGRVETNPIELLSLPTPEGIFFGYRMVWASHVRRSAARAVNIDGTAAADPLIHHSEEATHYLGSGWLDDYSDRLYLNVRNKPISDPPVQGERITWQHRMGTVTFVYSSGAWRSGGGKFELIDRAPNAPHTPPADGLGRWVVRTVDSTAPRLIWTFEETSNTDWAGISFGLGRLKRHALLTSNLADLNGRYGFTVSWNANGTIANATDSLGRQLIFSYSTVSASGIRTLAGIAYKPAASAAVTPLVELQMSQDRLERVRRIDSSSYTRFLYYTTAPPDCENCSLLITAVLQPGPGPLSTPLAMAPKLSTEIAIEQNSYGKPPLPLYQGRYIGTASSSPGRSYAYKHEVDKTTQYDLNQPQPASCAGGVGCAAGFECYPQNNQCYRAETIQHQPELRLPTLRAIQAGGTSSFGGSPLRGDRSYTTTGAPRTVTDASGMKTTYGFDSSARVRCIVRKDDDDEAFATPSAPDTSACAGPADSQIVRVDYTATTITKTTPSLLSGSVVETTTLDSVTLLPSSISTTGSTKDINGAIQSQTRTTSKAYDAYGRVTEVNGPLSDSTALDKTTTSYYTTYNATWPFDFGQVYQVTTYVGTSSSSVPITETYSEYDAFGIPHRVVSANGQAVTFSPSADRLTWTIRECATGAGCTTLSTSTVVFNPDGSVRSATDPDNVCTTYKYTEGNVYIGAPTRIRRAPAYDSCGADITGALENIGEIEIRTYVSGEADRLASIVRRTDGVQEYILDGFVYDRERRLTNTPFVSGGSTFSVLYTDVLQTGVVAPGGPSAGSWKTDTTVDAFGRPSSIQRFIDSTNKITHNLTYASPWSPRPTTLTRGQNGTAIATTSFGYDDFGRLVESTVPEAGPPGSPSPARFEYDVGDRLIKKRVGTGTTMVRTDLRTYDSLGRLLSVDNDLEHPVTCGTAPAGTPIQDEEYKYDGCSAPDVPTGFSCGNALGRLAIAREILQCGTSAQVKRGRWYDYDTQGRVKRIAYATVIGSSVGAPAIADMTYSPGGRVMSAGSPLNVAYGTAYDYTNGRIFGVNRTAGTRILWNATYRAFGPMKSFETLSQLNTGTSVRNLSWTGVSGTNYAGNGFSWIYKTKSGPDPDIAFMNQSFTRSPSGLLKTRADAASSTLSRNYFYDALARLTGELMSIGASSWLMGSYLFGNGLSATQPPDARRQATTRSGDVNFFLLGSGDGYVSPGPETTTYTAGSTQPQGTSHAGGGLVFVYDLLGRRTSEYDINEPSTSKRNYTYLPNGQLGSVESATTGGLFEMRYDEQGRPVTITESYSGSLFNTYELFWDDASRLVATQITFGTVRPYPQTTPCTVPAGCVSYSGIRWHYHYLGNTVVAATRELIHFDGSSVPKLFWFLTDERGLVHRVVDASGQTWWQAQWDANGIRTWIGTPQTEMWIPFGLPGQIVLGDTQYELYQPFKLRAAGSEAGIRPLNVSATASSTYAAGYAPGNVVDKSLSTRWSSIFADNQWIMLDLGRVKPIAGVRLTWELAYADGYRIEVANGPNGPWTTMYSTTVGNGGLDEISFSASARYIRMFGTHRAIGGNLGGFSLWEFEVFGPWTRSAIALNGARSYDPLGAFMQPDDSDVEGRFHPEGYMYAFSSPLDAADADGLRGRSWLQVQGLGPWKWSTGNAACRARKGEIEAAIDSAWDQILSCTSGECAGYAGSGSFKRQWIWALLTGTYYCAEVGSPAKVSVNGRYREYGVYEDYEGKHTVGTLKGGYGASAWALTPPPATGAKLTKRVTILASFSDCLARDLAHEAAHWVYYTLPANALYSPYDDYVMSAYGPGSLHEYNLGESGNDKADHGSIKEIEKCVSCSR